LVFSGEDLVKNQYYILFLRIEIIEVYVFLIFQTRKEDYFLITSVNLSSVPFQSSTDSTRLQMSSKQLQQTLTHPNCDIPYVIESNYQISRYSKLGIEFASGDGSVVFKNAELMIVNYDESADGRGDGLKIFEIPPVKKTHGVYSSKLRSALAQSSKFGVSDVLYEYDCFSGGVSSIGYNAMTAYNIFFGFNHEDSLVISESFANRAKVSMTEKIYLPIYDYTLLDAIYPSQEDFIYFPGIGKSVQKNIICQSFIPKDNSDDNSISNQKAKVIQLLKNLGISDFLSFHKSDSSVVNQFRKESVKTKINNGVLTGFKIHKLNKNVNLIDKRLQSVLEKMYDLYSNFIIDVYNDLNCAFNEKFSRQILKKHYVYNSTNENKLDLHAINMKDCIFLLEFEISKEDTTHMGDKLSNR